MRLNPKRSKKSTKETKNTPFHASTGKEPLFFSSFVYVNNFSLVAEVLLIPQLRLAKRDKRYKMFY